MKRRPVLALLLVVGLSCSSPTGECRCSPPPPGNGLVFGTVSRAGAAVAGAEVQVGVRQPGCVYDLVERAPVVTDPAGHYRALVEGHADSACLRVTARDPATSGTVVRDWVLTTFSLGGPMEVPAESVRVDLALPAASGGTRAARLAP